MQNCKNVVTGKYCGHCGEKVYTRHDRTLVNLIEEGAHFITHLDGSFFNTIKALFTSPGKLSTDYCNGIRKKYFKPVSFFLLLVIIYLLFPVFEGLNQQLQYHLDNGLYGSFASQKIAQLMHNSGLTMKQVETQFHEKGEKVSKFLLLVIIPLSALFFWLCTFKKRFLFYDQVIFATEINTFYLLWGYLLMPLFTLLLYEAVKFFTGNKFYLQDKQIGTIIYVVFAFYVSKASKKFYALKTWQSVVLSIIFVFAHFAVIQHIYKFLLFKIVIWQVH